MTWNPIWDEIFLKKEWGKYPPEELVRFVARNYYKSSNRKEIKFLDLGCGYGCGSWYLAREGFDVTAIDGSKIIVDKLKDRLKKDKLKANIIKGDFVNLPFPNDSFDCVVDLYALMCNSYSDTSQIITEIYRILKPSGKLLSITVSSETNLGGKKLFNDIGMTRYTAKKEIKRLYGHFTKISIDYFKRTQDQGKSVLHFWVIDCTK